VTQLERQLERQLRPQPANPAPPTG